MGHYTCMQCGTSQLQTVQENILSRIILATYRKFTVVMSDPHKMSVPQFTITGPVSIPACMVHPIYKQSKKTVTYHFSNQIHTKCSFYTHIWGAGCSSEVERSLMVRWVVRSILHGVDPLSYFSFQPVLHDWCNKGRGMCYPVCGMVHIKEPLLLINKSSLCGGSGFPFSLSEWSLTICLTPYNRR